MSRSGGLAVYVTSHGFGHLNRAVAVVNAVPPDVPVAIHCGADLFPAWRERLVRPATFVHQTWDAGAVNPPGDSAATDGPATIARALQAHAAALAALDEEVYRLRDRRPAAVLCDVPAAPLEAAAIAGVPGYALANFTWSEIYAEHAAPMGDEAQRLVVELDAMYHKAEAAFRCEPALPMRAFARQIEVGLVASPGRDRRAELRAALGLADSEKMVYFYIGRYGQDDLDWRRLADLRGIHFVGFHGAPAGVEPPPNLHVVPASRWNGADLLASCDAAVAKAGYGTVAEAMAHATPLIYPPRAGFAEHEVLDLSLRRWGGGVPVPADQFAALDLAEPLARALAGRPGPPPFPTDGATRVAEALTRLARHGARP